MLLVKSRRLQSKRFCVIFLLIRQENNLAFWRVRHSELDRKLLVKLPILWKMWCQVSENVAKTRIQSIAWLHGITNNIFCLSHSSSLHHETGELCVCVCNKFIPFILVLNLFLLVFIAVVVDSPVAFYATLKKKTTFEDGETVIFDNVITNFGARYSGKCGTFRGENGNWQLQAISVD